MSLEVIRRIEQLPANHVTPKEVPIGELRQGITPTPLQNDKVTLEGMTRKDPKNVKECPEPNTRTREKHRDYQP